MNFLSHLLNYRRRKKKAALQLWKEGVKKRIDKNQDWLYPIMLAVASGGISFTDGIMKNEKNISSFMKNLCFLSMELFVLSIFYILLHFYLDIKWSTEYLEREDKNDNKDKIDRLPILIDFSFWFLIVAIFISIIFYSYVQFK